MSTHVDERKMAYFCNSTLTKYVQQEKIQRR